MYEQHNNDRARKREWAPRSERPSAGIRVKVGDEDKIQKNEHSKEKTNQKLVMYNRP